MTAAPPPTLLRRPPPAPAGEPMSAPSKALWGFGLDISHAFVSANDNSRAPPTPPQKRKTQKKTRTGTPPTPAAAARPPRRAARRRPGGCPAPRGSPPGGFRRRGARSIYSVVVFRGEGEWLVFGFVGGCMGVRVRRGPVFAYTNIHKIYKTTTTNPSYPRTCTCPCGSNATPSFRTVSGVTRDTASSTGGVCPCPPAAAGEAWGVGGWVKVFVFGWRAGGWA